MMKKIFILFSLLILTFAHKEVKGQIIKPDIQFVTIQDTFLINVIDSLITYNENYDSLFSKGFGYFMVSLNSKVRQGEFLNKIERIDTVLQYTIGISFMHPDPKENNFDDFYPGLYSFVNDRLVVFSGSNYEQYFGFSYHSKKIFERILGPFLEEPGSSSREIMKLESVQIYYLKNNISGEYLKPKIVYDSIPK